MKHSTPFARYLGPELSDSGSPIHEAKGRVRFAWGVWTQYRELWKSNAPLKHRRNVFISDVVSLLTDILHIFICFAIVWPSLRSHTTRCCECWRRAAVAASPRRLMAASYIRPWPVVELCRYLRIVPVHIIISANRLRFLQSMFKHPDQHDPFHQLWWKICVWKWAGA